MRKCIENLVWTSEHAVWLNLTFWENVTKKAYANKCWDKLCKTIRRENPDFRLVGVWARQGRGAWHIHAVCNQRFDLVWLKSKAMRCGFGQSFFVKELDSRKDTPQKIARYITGYCTDKNGLDPVKDKGIRRTIFVGKNVKVVNMRWKSVLKKVTALGKSMAEEFQAEEFKEMTKFEKEFSTEGRKKSWETWGDWYRRNRDYWFKLGWDTLSDEIQKEYKELDEFCSRYFETGRWSYV
jgi:hypothetical protein